MLTELITSSLPENREAVIAQTTRGDAPRSVVEADFKDSRVAWRDRFSPLFGDHVVDHYRSVADYTYAQGLVRTKVDVDALIDRRFSERALKNLGLEGWWSAIVSRHSREGGNPYSQTSVLMDSRLRGNDGQGRVR